MIKGIICDFGGIFCTDINFIIDAVFEENGFSRDLANSIWRKHWPQLKVGTGSVEDYWREMALYIH